MTVLNFSQLTQEAATANFSVLPDADYPIVVDEAVYTDSSNNKPMIKVKAKVTEGPHANATIMTQFVLTSDNAQALNIFFRHMAAFGLPDTWFATLGQNTLEPVAQALNGRRAIFTVGKHEYPKGQNPPVFRNQVNGVKPYTGTPQLAGLPGAVPQMAGVGAPGAPGQGFGLPGIGQPGIPQGVPQPGIPQGVAVAGVPQQLPQPPPPQQAAQFGAPAPQFGAPTAAPPQFGAPPPVAPPQQQQQFAAPLPTAAPQFTAPQQAAAAPPQQQLGAPPAAVAQFVQPQAAPLQEAVVPAAAAAPAAAPSNGVLPAGFTQEMWDNLLATNPALAEKLTQEYAGGQAQPQAAVPQQQQQQYQQPAAAPEQQQQYQQAPAQQYQQAPPQQYQQAAPQQYQQQAPPPPPQLPI